MKRSYCILAALALVLAGSCSRMEENVIDNNEPILGTKLTFKATQGDNPETRTVRQGDGSIWWSKDDAINVFYGNATGKFTTDITEPAATASFTGTLEGDTEGGSVYWGVYPYNVNNTFDGTGVTLTIPSEQKGVPGTFADKLNPSVARSETESLSFYNVGSWFVFTVAGEGITSATFKGNKNEDIAGKVKVTMDSDGKPVATVQEGVKSITVTPEEGDAFVPGKEYRIVLLPQTMEAGYTITLFKGNQSTDCVVNKEAAFGRSMFRGRHTVDSGKWHGDYVDLGEGQLWATMNVGAASETDAGSFFAWGETSAKADYSWSTYTWGSGENSLTKYVLDNSYGTVDNLSVLESEDDAATANWGEGWRTPTASEWLWLYSNCDRSIEQVDGVTGFRYTSRIAGYTSNSIFIPATKYYDGSTLVEGEGQVSYYWSSSLNGENSIYAQSNGISQTHDILNGPTPQYRYLGLPVRAVCTLPTSVTGIELSQSSLNMELGDSPYTLGATILPDNATNQTITWSSSDESIASIVVNGNACNIVAAGVGTATITATTADGGYTASCTVKVTGVPVTGVTLDKTSLTLGPGNRYTLTANVQPANASVKTVKWSSSNPDDVYVSEEGEVVALAENGSSTITVTTDNGGFTATCEVTVVYIHITSVTLNKTTLTLPAGQSETLIATILPENATNRFAVWSSSDESVATVSDNGTVTAVEDCRGGTATITASCEGGTLTATCKVTVTVPVTEVVLYNDNLSICLGDTYQLEASVRPAYATNQNISWSSSNTSVAAVNATGLVTAKAVGTATITATSKDGGFTDSCIVTVTPAEINGHAYVKMGVKSADGKVLKWATYNVGASKPEGYGNYYAWGEVSTKNNYSWSTYFYGNSSTTLTKYVTSSYNGTVDNKTVLEDVDDVARWSEEWGETWRMPTDKEWADLRNSFYCTWEWTGDYNGTGVAGYIVTCKYSDYKGNQLFLPAAGYRDGTSFSNVGTHGSYWSSSLLNSDPTRAYKVYFYSGSVSRDYGYRYYGYPVRPVSE